MKTDRCLINRIIDWLIAMLKKLLSLLRLAIAREGDIFIGHILHDIRPFEAKPNEWGGVNLKFNAHPGQMVMALKQKHTDTEGEVCAEWDEIVTLSMHTRVPEYRVTLPSGYAIRCSPKNSILVKDGGAYKEIDISINDVTGMLTPIYTSYGEVSDTPIISSVKTGKYKTMYDITLKNNTIFLADNFLFIMDTIAVHVPVSRKSIDEAINMMPSRNMYDDAGGKIRAFPDHSAAVGIYIMSKTKEGRDNINSVLPAEYRITEKITKPALVSILTKMAHDDSSLASKAVDSLVRLGNDYAYTTGFSYGLSDIKPFTEMRDNILSDVRSDMRSLKDKSPDNMREIYKNHSERASNEMAGYFENKDNPMGDILVSKARGSASQMRDVLFSPISVNAAEVISKPIKHSYIEGLSPSEYFAAAAGARAGTIGKSIGTAQPGALGKVVFTNTNSLVINKDRGESMGVIRLPVDKPNDLVDRYLGEDVYAGSKLLFEKGTDVTPRTVQIAKKNGVSLLPVYTPLMSSSADGGIPAMAYGIVQGNKLPEVGYNIGAHAAAGIVNPLYTESMQSFHTGSSLQDRGAGYPRLKQVLELTKSISNKATLSSVKGIVSDIRKDSLGGHTITIEGKEHYVQPSNKVNVHVGTPVEKGDPLCEGPIDPRDISKYKGLPAAQEYMVNEIVKNTPGNLKRRAAEVVVESITRHGEVIDPGSSEYLPGDIRLASELEKRNKSLDEKIRYEPVFKGVTTLPLASQSWMAQLNFRNIKKSLSNAIATGASSDVHSYEPAPALAWSTEFGDGENGKY